MRVAASFVLTSAMFTQKLGTKMIAGRTMMRDLRQIIKDNGGDDTPALDTHNLTGRATPKEVEPDWTPLEHCGGSCGTDECC
jgi:hypothetical protein